MKKKVIILSLAIASMAMEAAGLVDFTSADFVQSLELNGQAGWTADSQWVIREKGATISSGWKKAVLERTAMSMNPSDEARIRVSFRCKNVPDDENMQLFGVGFSASSQFRDKSKEGAASITIVARKGDSSVLQLRGSNNEILEVGNANIPKMNSDEDLIILEYKLIMGSCAADTKVEGRLINAHTGVKSEIGSYTGISPTVYAAAGRGIYPSFHSAALGGKDNRSSVTTISIESIRIEFGADDKPRLLGAIPMEFGPYL